MATSDAGEGEQRHDPGCGDDLRDEAHVVGFAEKTAAWNVVAVRSPLQRSSNGGYETPPSRSIVMGP